MPYHWKIRRQSHVVWAHRFYTRYCVTTLRYIAWQWRASLSIVDRHIAWLLCHFALPCVDQKNRQQKYKWHGQDSVISPPYSVQILSCLFMILHCIHVFARNNLKWHYHSVDLLLKCLLRIYHAKELFLPRSLKRTHRFWSK